MPRGRGRRGRGTWRRWPRQEVADVLVGVKAEEVGTDQARHDLIAHRKHTEDLRRREGRVQKPPHAQRRHGACAGDSR